MDCASLALQVAPISYYCLKKFIGLRPKLGNTFYHIFYLILDFLFTCHLNNMPAKLSLMLEISREKKYTDGLKSFVHKNCFLYPWRHAYNMAAARLRLLVICYLLSCSSPLSRKLLIKKIE